jgi:hypothetical protein
MRRATEATAVPGLDFAPPRAAKSAPRAQANSLGHLTQIIVINLSPNAAPYSPARC